MLIVKFLVTRGYFFAVFLYINLFKKQNPELQAHNDFGWRLDYFFLASALMPLISIIMRIICFPLWYFLLIDVQPDKVHD
jgi:hypothetical protein